MGNDGKPKGFGTRNDLERHAKSRHKIAPVSSVDRTYMCKAPGCPRPAKPWPRTDNFRQHCKRMHCHLDVDKLVAASLVSPEQAGFHRVLDPHAYYFSEGDIEDEHLEMMG